MPFPVDPMSPLTQLLDSARIGMYRLDGRSGVVTLNASAQQIFGAHGRTTDAAGLAGFVHPDDVASVSATLAQALLNGWTFEVEHRLARRPGWVRVHGMVGRPPEEPWGVTGLVMDVTPTRRAQAEVRESLGRYQLLVDAAPIGIALHVDGRIVYANRAATEMIGGSAEDVVGRSALEFVAPQYREAALERIERLRAGDVGHDEPLIEEHFVRADGTQIPVLVTALRSSWNGRPAIQVLFVDLSHSKGLERQLRHSQRLESLGRLAGGVAHDFNNLLTVMLGAAEYIGTRSTDPKVLSAVASIGSAATRGVGITRQLLSFARQDTFLPRPVEICAVLRDSRALLGPLLGATIALDLEIDEPQWVAIDPVQLDQVLVNLAVNARDAMPDGGSLTIRAYGTPSPGGPVVRIEVVDTGPGIEPGVAERVFEPFFTTKPIGTGTGLGLSTSLGIVEQAGGTIELDSTPGEGSRFTIVLPGIEPPSDPGPAVDEISLDASGPRPVLLVEDDSLVREVVCEALELRGYQVTAAADGPGALRELERLHRLEAVICDVVLPGENGPEVVARIRERVGDVRTLFVSGYAPERLDRDILGPMTAFLQKPYTVTQLVTALEDLMAR